MFSYLYLVLFAVFCIFHVLRNVQLFKKDQYNPYIFRKGSGDLPFIIRLSINLGIILGSYFLLPISDWRK